MYLEWYMILGTLLRAFLKSPMQSPMPAAHMLDPRNVDASPIWNYLKRKHLKTSLMTRLIQNFTQALLARWNVLD